MVLFNFLKKYLDQNVYDALQERRSFLFREFDNLFVSFSGGKDSGLLLNLVLEYAEKYAPHRRIGVFHRDFEAQYSYTTQYVTETFRRLEGKMELYSLFCHVRFLLAQNGRRAVDDATGWS